MSSYQITHDLMKSIALGPRKHIRRWDHYYINDYNFHTYSYGKEKSTMKYGVSVKGIDGVEYCGILQEVIELTNLGSARTYKTILFKSDWFDSVNGLNVHEHYKLVDVNHTRKYPSMTLLCLHTKWHKYALHFILAWRMIKANGGQCLRWSQQLPCVPKWMMLLFRRRTMTTYLRYLSLT